MKTKNLWTVSDISITEPMHSNDLEFQDGSGVAHDFTVIVTPSRVVFGGLCNVGFLESGFIEREDGESICDTLGELVSNLQTFYDDGAKYATRLTVNERM